MLFVSLCIWCVTYLFCFVKAPAPYGNDLRVAVIYQRFLLGQSVKDVAYQNQISTRTVIRYCQRYQEFESILPDPQLFGETRGRNATITRHELDEIVNIVMEEPTLYLDEIQRILYHRLGSNLTVNMIHRWLRRVGITRQRLFVVQLAHPHFCCFVKPQSQFWLSCLYIVCKRSSIGKCH